MPSSSFPKRRAGKSKAGESEKKRPRRSSGDLDRAIGQSTKAAKMLQQRGDDTVQLSPDFEVTGDDISEGMRLVLSYLQQHDDLKSGHFNNFHVMRRARVAGILAAVEESNKALHDVLVALVTQGVAGMDATARLAALANLAVTGTHMGGKKVATLAREFKDQHVLYFVFDPCYPAHAHLGHLGGASLTQYCNVAYPRRHLAPDRQGHELATKNPSMYILNVVPAELRAPILPQEVADRVTEVMEAMLQMCVWRTLGEAPGTKQYGDCFGGEANWGRQSKAAKERIHSGCGLPGDRWYLEEQRRRGECQRAARLRGTC